MAPNRIDLTGLLARHRPDPLDHSFDVIEILRAAMRAALPTALLESALDRWERQQ